MKRLTLFLSVLFLGQLLALAEAQVGKPAPDFTATDINGKTHQLSDYKGRIVVLESYNLDCPFCGNHFKTGAMQELQAYAASRDVVWLLVNSASRHSGSYRNPAAARKEFAAQKMKAPGRSTTGQSRKGTRARPAITCAKPSTISTPANRSPWRKPNRTVAR